MCRNGVCMSTFTFHVCVRVSTFIFTHTHTRLQNSMSNETRYYTHWDMLCELCHFHLDGTCRCGQRCTYAHSWDERLEWICPICTKDGKCICDEKWQHILQYKCIGVYVVADGRTVGEFLKTT